jgi:hypothetical protein
MKEQLSTFIIVREDRGLDPTTLVDAGLKIGRAPERDLVLNHPDVSRLHAGIKEIGGRFYLFNLSSSNSTTLNGGLVALEEPKALADGDEVRLGPFFLRMHRQGEALQISVTLQFGLRIGEDAARKEAPAVQPVAVEIATPAPGAVVQALDLFWSKRSREKAGRPSPLHPRRPPRLGKARFNWTPTRDLVRPWPFSVFLWAVVLVTPLAIVGAFFYTSAYAPEPVSNAHSRSDVLSAAIATRANKGSCITCHSLSGSMESNCESCHHTEMFVSTRTISHVQAGIGCLDCHTEHKGKDFRPMQAALDSCTKCHNAQNKNTYKGKTVSTPHGGAFGYPVVDGKWIWRGLDPDELADRKKIAVLHLPDDTEKQWISKQFHALHFYQVKATRGITGVAYPPAGSAPVLSCQSCHQSFGTNVDRKTPRTTCGKCHNGMKDALGQTLVAANAPNCISCHVQHLKDKRHWNPEMLADKVQEAAGEK